jgi:transposase
MSADELRAEVLRLYHAEAWPIGTIARTLGVHHDVVSRVLKREGLPSIRAVRPSMIEPFLPFLRETLEQHPRLQAQRLYDMCTDRGYPGGPDHFRHLLRGLRPKPVREPFARLSTLPAEEAQVDWGHFGRVSIGRARRQLVAFVMVLSWSRTIFMRFFLGAPMECFLRGHVSAFGFLEGVPRQVLYDNLKSAVLERRGAAVRFHPTILALAAHYRFQPKAAEIRRPTDKGRVERAIRFVRGSFFGGRRWRDLEDLNAQAREWCTGRAARRPHTTGDVRTVGEAFEEERALLQSLPPAPFPTESITEAAIGKTPYVRFDGNDYSVPIELVHGTVSVAASEERVRILSAGDLVCEHARSYDKGALIEDPEHLEALGELKRRARKGRLKDRLARSVPSTVKLFEELARRGVNLGASVTALLRLLDEYGAQRLEAATREALDRETPEPTSIRLILERRRLEAGLEPRLPVQLPDDPRVRDLAVRPASLEQYGILREAADEADEAGEVPSKEESDGQS